MRHHRIKRFRYRSNSRSYQARNNGGEQASLGSAPFSSDRVRNNFKMQQSAEKLVEKYTALGKEALTSGDRILSENYFQHADHFTRIICNKNLYQNQNKIQANNKSIVADKPTITDKPTIKSSETNQDQNITKKKE